MKLSFPRDTKFRKELFTLESFKHPAKLDVNLCLWLTERFTKPGDTILDPMSGTGTQMIACTRGRNVVLVELEQRFVDMAKANWEKVKKRSQIGTPIGECKIHKGDSRWLEDVLADVVITSPPYEASVSQGKEGPLAGANEKRYGRWQKGTASKVSYTQHGEPCKADVTIFSPPYAENTHHSDEASDLVDFRPGRTGRVGGTAGNSDGQVGQLSYGNVDAVISSPPYGELANEKKNTKSNVSREERLRRAGHKVGDFMGGKARSCSVEEGLRYSRDPNNIGNLKYGSADAIITSPPYAEAQSGGGIAQEGYTKQFQKDKIGGGNMDPVGERTYMPENVGSTPGNVSSLKYGDVDVVVTSPPYGKTLRHDKGDREAEFEKLRAKGYRINPSSADNKVMGDQYSKSPNNIGNLKYGSADAIITSPPYEGLDPSQSHMTSNKRGDPSNPNYRPSWKAKLDEGYAETKRPYHPVDAVVTSPPYQEVMGQKHHSPRADKLAEDKANPTTYTLRGNGTNVGNLQGQTYLQAMATIYAQCLKVLKPGGLMILITKNFIRKRKVVRLDLDTIKLCESVGLKLVERHERKLPGQSFWRVLYHQKNPTVPMIEYEDVLVFEKEC